MASEAEQITDDRKHTDGLRNAADLQAFAGFPTMSSVSDLLNDLDTEFHHGGRPKGGRERKSTGSADRSRMVRMVLPKQVHSQLLSSHAPHLSCRTLVAWMPCYTSLEWRNLHQAAPVGPQISLLCRPPNSVRLQTSSCQLHMPATPALQAGQLFSRSWRPPCDDVQCSSWAAADAAGV